MIHIAILASGSGTNAENLIKYFEGHPQVKVSGVYTNNPKAYVIKRARDMNIPVGIFNRDELYHTDFMLEEWKTAAEFLILAGFLWLIPQNVVKAFPKRIINIHPALLPKYGGKGMYGGRVHEAVIENREHKSGITIHYVNEKYDEGAIIFQKEIAITAKCSPKILAGKIHKLEYKYFPQIVEKEVLKYNNL